METVIIFVKKNMAKKRNTKGKQMVIDVLSNSSQALSVDDIHYILSELDRSTIYRILLSFQDDCFVHSIEVDGKIFFALCNTCCKDHVHNDDHVHFKCEKCEKITCLDHSVLVTKLEPGYIVNQIDCLLIGLCKLCS